MHGKWVSRCGVQFTFLFSWYYLSLNKQGIMCLRCRTIDSAEDSWTMVNRVLPRCQWNTFTCSNSCSHTIAYNNSDALPSGLLRCIQILQQVINHLAIPPVWNLNSALSHATLRNYVTLKMSLQSVQSVSNCLYKKKYNYRINFFNRLDIFYLRFGYLFAYRFLLLELH